MKSPWFRITTQVACVNARSYERPGWDSPWRGASHEKHREDVT